MQLPCHLTELTDSCKRTSKTVSSAIFLASCILLVSANGRYSKNGIRDFKMTYLKLNPWKRSVKASETLLLPPAKMVLKL